MGKKEMVGMDELVEAVGAAINSAAPFKLDALARIITAYSEDCPDDYRWATGPQAPMLLSRLILAVTPGGLAQPKHISNPTPMRQYLYNACLDGAWPIQCIEGYKNWETGPIRFFYEEFRSAFHAWCNRSHNVPGGKGQNFSRLVLAELHETLPGVNMRLRCKVQEGSLVHVTPSDGRARVVEIPPLSVCRTSFDQLFKSSRDWTARPPRTADGRRMPVVGKSAASVKLEKVAKRNAHFRPRYEVQA
jgi:hypothetical protein